MSESPVETLEKALGLHFISKMGPWVRGEVCLSLALGPWRRLRRETRIPAD